MGKISEFRRYAIDVTGLDLLSLEELVGGPAFFEFGASGHVRTMKIGWRVRDRH